MAKISMQSKDFNAIREAFGFQRVNPNDIIGSGACTIDMQEWWQNFENSADDTTWGQYPLRRIFILAVLQNYGLTYAQWINPFPLF